jgi:Transposase
MQGQKSPERSAETRVYVGIDVWKDWLDVDIHPIGGKFRVPNTPEGLKSLKRRIAAMPDALVVMEATAKYHRQPHRTLHAAGYAVAIVNPLRARLFAQAFGQLAKTDKLDARLLATRGECLKPEAHPLATEELEAGQEIVRARSAAMADRTALANQHLASQTAFLKGEIGRRLTVLAKHIDRLDAEIECRLAADPALKRRWDPNKQPIATRQLTLIRGLDPEPLQLGLRTGVGLLQIDVPIAQILKLNFRSGHRAEHESAGTQNAKFAIEIFDLGFGRGDRAAFITVHWSRSSIRTNLVS